MLFATRLPLKLAVAPTVKEAADVTETVPVNVTLPEAVSVVELTLTKDACPAELTEAVVVPVAGTEIELNVPILAATLPVEACERSSIPLMLSIPKTVEYPLIQFWRIRKLELIVTLDPEIESDPKISVMFTVAIFKFYFFLSEIYINVTDNS